VNAALVSTALVRPDRTTRVPALVAGAGQGAARRFLEFFTVNIRNKDTRAAYAPAAGGFLRWWEGQEIDALSDVEPVHVAAYIERLAREMSPHTVKQHLACIRMLFDWLVTGQVMPSNPAQFRAGAAPLDQQGRIAGTVFRRSNGAARGHECFNRGGPARPGHHRRYDVHLRPRLCGCRARRRGLLCAEKTLVAAAARKNGKLNEMVADYRLFRGG